MGKILHSTPRLYLQKDNNSLLNFYLFSTKDYFKSDVLVIQIKNYGYLPFVYRAPYDLTSGLVCYKNGLLYRPASYGFTVPVKFKIEVNSAPRSILSQTQIKLTTYFQGLIAINAWSFLNIDIEFKMTFDNGTTQSIHVTELVTDSICYDGYDIIKKIEIFANVSNISFSFDFPSGQADYEAEREFPL